MSLLKEFREFAMRGNVVDLAIGVVIGTAFGKIVSSLVADIIMPSLGWLMGDLDLSQLHWVIRPIEGTLPAIVINYGMFIQNIFDFVIIAFAIFTVIKLMNKTRRKQAESPIAPPPPSQEEVLLAEIRDILKQQK